MTTKLKSLLVVEEGCSINTEITDHFITTICNSIADAEECLSESFDFIVIDIDHVDSECQWLLSKAEDIKTPIIALCEDRRKDRREDKQRNILFYAKPISEDFIKVVKAFVTLSYVEQKLQNIVD